MDSVNNLKGCTTYLVGAMDRVDDNGITWRKEITSELQHLNVKIINPCEKPIYGLKEDNEMRWWIDYYKETGQYSKIREKFGVIRNADLRCVDVSDFIIAHIDMDVHMCGSYEEIVTANRQKKPILVWCKQGKNKAPNWLFFMLSHEHIFNNMNELIQYLKYVDSIKNLNSLNRWFFFNDK